MLKTRRIKAIASKHLTPDEFRFLAFAREIESEVSASMQARIDELMLEYCPDEMTEHQKTTWAEHQRPINERN